MVRPVCEQNEGAESTQSNSRHNYMVTERIRAGGTRLPVLHALSSRHSLVQNALTSLVCRLTWRAAAVVDRNSLVTSALCALGCRSRAFTRAGNVGRGSRSFYVFTFCSSLRWTRALDVCCLRSPLRPPRPLQSQVQGLLCLSLRGQRWCCQREGLSLWSRLI